MLRRATTLLSAATIALTLLPLSSVAAAVGEGTGLPGFGESWGCDDPSTINPRVSRSGWLSDSESIRGPRGDFFGRTVGAVRDHLVWWTVPMSGGKRILVHERALPAFAQVTTNLDAQAALGNWYAVRPSHTYGFAPRTTSGSYGLSNHALGIAADINSTTNPYRRDNELITDMPDWFVQAWRDAGFCWGGDWKGKKDPMHFAWKGPAATPGYGATPAPFPPATGRAGFTDMVVDRPVVFGVPDPDRTYAVVDADGDGVADVVSVAQRDFGILIDYSQTDRDNSWCSADRFHILAEEIGDRRVVFGDYRGLGRQDVWLLDPSGATLSIEVWLRQLDELEESVTISTEVPPLAGDEYLLGDSNRDGHLDLFVVRASGALEIWDGTAYDSKLADVELPASRSGARSYSLGDRDVDGRHDLFIIDAMPTASTMLILTASSGYTGMPEELDLPSGGEWVDVAIDDFDGDGRGDLFTYDSGGRLQVRLGNTAMAGVDIDGWLRSPDWECDPETKPYVFDGAFWDDDDSIHVEGIEWAAAAGISRGCNPPYNDAFCPYRPVTRAEMAAFLVRALDLTEGAGTDHFTDDDGSLFEADIDRLAAAGITAGCNPPENSAFCPASTVTRGQMAAFLVRAFDLPVAPGDPFTDDEGSVFEADIAALFAAGITVGCNPPAYDRYCPNLPVQRDQMATFLARASVSAP